MNTLSRVGLGPWCHTLTSALLALLSVPASAITITFASSTEAQQVFFAGTNHEIAGRLIGTGVPPQPVGIASFSGAFDDDFDVVDGGPVVQHRIAVGGFIANQQGLVHPGAVPGETRRMSFNFSIAGPGVVSGPSSVLVEYDVLVRFIGNGQFQRDWTLVSPASQSFDLGAAGILDAQFLAPAPSQGRPATGGGSLIFANFSLSGATVTAPEPGTTALLLLGLAGCARAFRRA